MKLIITRHGETEENKVGIMQGHLPGTLSQEGITQAEKVALRLKDDKIDVIYSSDLARAADTAKKIAVFHPETKIEFTEEIRERNFGEFQGKKKSDFGWDPKDYKAMLLNPKNGETIEEVYTRAENFIHKIFHKHIKDTVLLVCHGGIGKTLIGVITGKKIQEIDEVENLHNTSVSIFEIDEEKNHKIICSNCIKHLDK